MIVRRLLFALPVLSLIVALALMPAASASGTAGASKGKAKGKCPKGKKLVVVKKNGKVVRKNGKPVKKCVKKTPPPPPPPPPTAKLFEEPGRVLEGNDAKPFIEKYLLNSTFTDCRTGWPTCGGFENRYSHSPNFTFYKCWLRPTSGSDVKSVGEYAVDAVKVEANGDWAFREVISWYSEFDVYEWKVFQDGTVQGANQPHPPDGPFEQLEAGLTYMSGVAKDCSY